METKLQYLGWDAFIITSPKGVRMVLDPSLLGDKNCLIPPSTFKPEDIQVDLVVASHGATDHFGEAFEIMRRNPRAQLLCGVDMTFHAREAGFGTIYDGRVELMVSGCSFVKEDVCIRCLDARHISFTYHNGHPVTGTAMCYVIQIQDGPTFFFGGDTSITSDFRLWGELYRPDVALLGVGGGIVYGGRSLDELDPVEAAIGADMLGVKLVVPMHFGNRECVERFKKESSVRLKNCKVLEMACGDIVAFDTPLPYRRIN